MEKKRTKRWLLRTHAYLKWPLVVMTAASVLLSATAVLFAYFTKFLLDEAEGLIQDTAAAWQPFIIGSVAVVAIIFFQIVLNALNSYLMAFYKAKADRRLKQTTYENLLKKKNPLLEKYHSGELMNHLTSDIQKVSEGVVEILPRFVFLILRFVFAFSLLVFLDWLFAVIMLAAGLVIFFAGLILRSEIKRRHHKMQDAEAGLRSYMQEGLENIPVIKSFEAEKHTLGHLEERQADYFLARIRRTRLNVFAGSALSAFFAFGYVFALVFGAYRVITGIITFGSLVAILQLVNQIQMPFSGLSTLFPRFYATLASADRLINLMELPEEQVPKEKPEGRFEKLAFQDITFAYDKTPVLKDFSLEAERGEFVHLRGPSGIGKTTIFKLLLGLVEPTEGRIILQTEKNELSVSSATRGYFTYVPQSHMILSGTIRDNLLYNRTEKSDKDIEEAARIACIKDTIQRMPNGLDTILGERGAGLSEGEIQRLAIARALLKGADVLLFDEITSALDEKTEKKVLQNIRDLTEKTCLVISHRPLEAGLIDKSIYLERGNGHADH